MQLIFDSRFLLFGSNLGDPYGQEHGARTHHRIWSAALIEGESNNSLYLREATRTHSPCGMASSIPPKTIDTREKPTGFAENLRLRTMISASSAQLRN